MGIVLMCYISSESDCCEDITLEQICEENEEYGDFQRASNIDRSVRWVTFEIAKSNSTYCQECKNKIDKGDPKINIIDCIFLFRRFKACKIKRFHPKCFSF